MDSSPLTINDYYPAPFWFLNHKLEKAELLRQLELMKAQGINAFFLHPRAGLKTPYGSREWFELIRYTAIEADKLGMKAWLYDEDPFPSGPAGGRIFMEHPEFAARNLVFHEFAPDADGRVCADLGEGKLLEALAVRCDEAGNVLESRDIFDDAGMIRSEFFRSDWHNSYYHHLTGKVNYDHYRAETFYPHLQLDIALEKNWKVFAVTANTVYKDSKYRNIPDNLNPDCVKEFMRWTHELYEKYMGDLFGTVIPGIFTDETATGGNFAWTPRVADEFKKRRGMEITGRYHEIFRGNSPSARNLREAYWDTVHELFIESFFAPVNQWCKDHNMALCGHGIGEELPLATTNGMNIFNIQKYTGIPGFDHITPNIPNWDDFTSLNLGGKLVASAAEQMGQNRVMTECFACNPYNFGHDGMKKNLCWLYSLGINWAVPHGFHYSYDGLRKDDAGKSFFFQSPDYPEFHKFGAFAADLGFRLGESRSTADICVLYPEGEFRKLFPAEPELALEKTEALYRCNQFLLQNQIQFEFADENTLRNARITPDGFICGKKFYRHLILPFAIEREYLPRGITGTLSALDFIDAGMNVCILGPSDSGKSYLAKAIGIEACNTYKVEYHHCETLLEEMVALKAADYSKYQKRMKKTCGAALLILDDFLLHTITDEREVKVLFEILEKRSEINLSTIICSQREPASWSSMILNDEVSSNAIMKRATRHYTVVIKPITTP
jgi:hypothetical protein